MLWPLARHGGHALMNNLALVLTSDADYFERVRSELAKVSFDCLRCDRFVDLENSLKSSTPSILVVEDQSLPAPQLDCLSSLMGSTGVPIILINRSEAGIDTTSALECGSLECLTASMSESEFNARLRHGAHLAATLFPSPGEIKLSDDTRLRYRDHQLIGPSRTIRLGYLETQLLLALGCQPGKPVDRNALCQAAWKRSLLPGDRRLDIRVVALNQKLREATNGNLYIRGVRNAGYRLQATSH